MHNNQDKSSVTYPSYSNLHGQLIGRLVFLILAIIVLFVVFAPSKGNNSANAPYNMESKTMEEMDMRLKR